MKPMKTTGMEIARNAPIARHTPAPGSRRREMSQNTAQEKAQNTGALRSGKRMATVLLVDDDINTLNALRELVAQEGYRVRTAEDGLDALRSALDEPPDVVISDCMMPHMDGLSLMREMRRNSVLMDVPLVLVSALVTPPPDADVVGFLRKPFAVSQLLDMLHRIAAP
ncbi:response regulator [Burkholderia sp. Ax-1719]|jgi:CheY-like chemotaxis protein|uniref:response regulator n=1 Tax=Burkholderia sp. Ax-1719 TaxID=2608334 RepID=UPI001420F1E2|nr:response regulator [Burkholderia sp. Ax-1719]NIE67717.1 response regulator [Burkholderia sp. Ax-1719]